nr:AAA family ATPase [Endozoicomonas sp.]
MRTFFLAPTRYGVGLTSVTLGLVRALDNLGLRVKFFKPIAQLHVGDTGPERSTKLVQRIMDHEPPTPLTSHRAENLLGDNKGDVLMEEIVALFELASQDCDVIVVEGLVPTRDMPYANRLNSNIAKTLNADIILVSEPGNDSLEDLADKLEIAADSFGGIKNPNVVGYALNKLSPELVARLNTDGHFQSLPEFARKPFQPLGYI